MKSLGQKPTVAELNDMINEVPMMMVMMMIVIMMVIMMMMMMVMMMMMMMVICRWTVMAMVRLTLRSFSP